MHPAPPQTTDSDFSKHATFTKTRVVPGSGDCIAEGNGKSSEVRMFDNKDVSKDGVEDAAVGEVARHGHAAGKVGELLCAVVLDANFDDVEGAAKYRASQPGNRAIGKALPAPHVI